MKRTFNFKRRFEIKWENLKELLIDLGSNNLEKNVENFLYFGRYFIIIILLKLSDIVFMWK